MCKEIKNQFKHADVQLLSITDNADKLITYAARVCYDSHDKPKQSDQQLIRMLWGKGHHSCFEHSKATFFLKGISRCLANQLVRHRISSFSQRSQRFVTEDNFSFVIPESIRKSKCFNKYVGLMQILNTVYKELMADGIPKQDARFVLPNACTTEIVVTMNFRALFNFFDHRLDKAAQWEIRGVAKLMLKLLLQYAPLSFEYYRDKYLTPDEIQEIKAEG